MRHWIQLVAEVQLVAALNLTSYQASTCADDGSLPAQAMEIIEVGAVWAQHDGVIVDRFQRFVKPIHNPVLTPFCCSLTHITQADVDGANHWPVVLEELVAFAKLHTASQWGSWGGHF